MDDFENSNTSSLCELIMCSGNKHTTPLPLVTVDSHKDLFSGHFPIPVDEFSVCKTSRVHVRLSLCRRTLEPFPF